MTAPNLRRLPAELRVVRQRARILLLLDAAERAGITPLAGARLHALAYLSDVLSPVWGLPPFDGKVLKLEGGPHYPDIQQELDKLVVQGLVEIANLRYLERPNGGARIDGEYSLNFSSEHLLPLLASLGAETPEEALDSRDVTAHRFLVDLATALSTLPNDEIDAAASVDATYADQLIDNSSIIDFEPSPMGQVDRNLSFAVTNRFQHFLPNEARFSAGERLYLYAAYLGKLVHE